MSTKLLAFKRAFAILLTCALSLTLFSIGTHARTISGSNKVVYEVIDETNHYVKVSSHNATLFASYDGELTIPATVQDEDGTEFEVWGLETGAFKGSAISKITFECLSGMMYMPSSVFQDCKNLETVIINAPKLYKIEEYCFSGCTKLHWPDFGSKIESIGKYAFQGCKNLGAVDFPNGYISFSMYAFYQASMGSITFNQSAGMSISPYAFSETSFDTDSIIFPSKIQQIQEYAFKNATTTYYGDPLVIDISKTTYSLEIQREAFYGAKVREVKFPEKLYSIGTSAFELCQLDTLQLPNCKFSMGNKAFGRNKIKHMKAENWPSVAQNWTATNILYYNLKLKSIEFPSWMTTIPDYVCSFCLYLEDIKLHDNVKTIGNYAFGHDYYNNNTGLKSVTLPESLTTMGSGAFAYNKNLSSVNIPSNLTIIPQGAFVKCGLTSVEIPSSVKEVGNSAFRQNPIETIILPEPENASYTPIKWGTSVFGYAKIKTFKAPAWMKTFGAYTFECCDSLRNVTFAPGTTSLPDYCFNLCPMLQLDELPPTITSYGKGCFISAGTGLPEEEYFVDNVVVKSSVAYGADCFKQAKIKGLEFADCDYALGQGAFSYVSSLRRISFPECLRVIPDQMCKGMSNLEEVVWPAHVQSIGMQAFSECPKVKFGCDDEGNGNILDMTKAPFDQLVKIGDKAFFGSSISEIIWPEEDRGIVLGESVFYNNSKLTKITIPAWMNNVPKETYYGCSAATQLIWEDSPRTSLTIGESAFQNIGIDRIYWPDVPTTLGWYAFRNCKNATWIDWPEHNAPVLSIYCFSQCSNLEGPTELPEYVTSLPNYVFNYCKSLPHFTLHEGITSIGNGIFEGCTSMEEITVKGDVGKMTDYFAQNCTNLKKLTFEYPIQSVGEYALGGCKNLENFNIPETSKFSTVGMRAFFECNNICNFPEEAITGDTQFGSFSIYRCHKIKHLNLPSAYSAAASWCQDTELQAINFLPPTNAVNSFNLYPGCLDFSPLLGVSYFTYDVAKDNLNANKTTFDYDSWSKREKLGYLVVGRDMKYRMVEKGFGYIWNIHELTDPDLTLYGDIHSTYTPGDKVNHYKSMLRWEVVLSDLNKNESTIYHLKRDGKEIAQIEFSVPYEVESVNEGNVLRPEPTTVVDLTITRDGVEYDKSDQYGDFLYETGENEFSLVYSNQHKKLYFDPESTHRVGLSEKFGARSWFLYIDEFDSPDLTSNDVPASYTYTLEMEGYKYLEPVNNEDYKMGEDGLYYHWEERTLENRVSEPMVVHTAIAIPDLTYDGTYSQEEIEADRFGTLPTSDQVNFGENVELAYHFSDPGQINHKFIDKSTVKPIIDHLTAYHVPSRLCPDGIREYETIVIKGDESKSESTVTIPDDEEPQSGWSFQTVITTNGRGVFGSQIVTVPAAPSLELKMTEKRYVGTGYGDHDHSLGIRHKLQLIPGNVDNMGYSSTPGREQHEIGMWRNVTLSGTTVEGVAYSPSRADETDPQEISELIHHCGEDVVTHNWACDNCSDLHGYSVNGDTWLYTDHLEYVQQDEKTVNGVDYRARIYVQDPNNPTQYMVAEATTNSNTIAGIENVRADKTTGTPVYYNLQGERVLRPTVGQLLIRIDSNGASKIRY